MDTRGTDGFGAENLPYGVDDAGRVVVAYRDQVIELASAGDLGVDPAVWRTGSLNAFLSLGPQAWQQVRRGLRERLGRLSPACLRRRAEVSLRLPFQVADYVDFYSSRAHVEAMGRLLRPGSPPLPDGWLSLPMGYHGRAGTVVVSGEPIPRPSGIRSSEDGPTYGPTARLDVEVELGFVVGVGNRRGDPIPAVRAAEHVFGVVLVNDWSARDIQSFEYRPLGPFLGKSFATSISPWVVPLEALTPWRVKGPAQEPPPAPYLQVPEPRGLDVQLELRLNGTVLSSMSTAALYWTMPQQLAHLTANGARVRPGDLFATGTVSEAGVGRAGSLMELTSAGRDPLRLDDGQTRRWLEDGDRVVITGWCGARGEAGWVSLGEVSGDIPRGGDTP